MDYRESKYYAKHESAIHKYVVNIVTRIDNKSLKQVLKAMPSNLRINGLRRVLMHVFERNSVMVNKALNLHYKKRRK